MLKCFLTLLIFFSATVHSSTPYIKQIKVWDDCTYSMEVIRIDLMQLKDNPFEDIDPKKAIELCTKSLESYPSDPHVKFLLARAYTKDKQYKKGFALASQACQNGDIGGCTLLGGYYNMSLSPQGLDLKKSTLLWLWSCSKGSSQACVNLYNGADTHTPFVPADIKNNDLRLLDLCSRGDYPIACLLYAKNCSEKRYYSQECRYASSRSCIAGDSTGCLHVR